PNTSCITDSIASRKTPTASSAAAAIRHAMVACERRADLDRMFMLSVTTVERIVDFTFFDVKQSIHAGHADTHAKVIGYLELRRAMPFRISLQRWSRGAQCDYAPHNAAVQRRHDEATPAGT